MDPPAKHPRAGRRDRDQRKHGRPNDARAEPRRQDRAPRAEAPRKQPGEDRAPRPEAQRKLPGIEALVRRRRLDLSLPASEPLQPGEVEEMNEHLAFLRSFKAVLRLPLNAAEDLLVNGARAPEDRGVCRHLLSKLDRATIERAVTREPLASDGGSRARFLAGAVRIHADEALLLRYLETLAEVADRREAARAFTITVDRVDFGGMKEAALARLVNVAARTFQGHDRVQAFFGLLEHEEARRRMSAAVAGLEPELAELFGGLLAVHRAAMVGLPPPEDAGGEAELDRGLRELLRAPDAVLRAYPEPVRARLLKLALARRLPDPAIKEAVRRLLDSLPKQDSTYVELRVSRVEELLAAGADADARALLNELVQSRPELTWARRRQEALRWKELGKLRLDPESQREGWWRAFWPEGSLFGWARLSPEAEAPRLAAEARLHAELCLPRVAPYLTHGSGGGSAFVLVLGEGQPLTRLPAPPELKAALELALEGVQLLKGLALAGVELPELSPARFFGGRRGLILADLSGARAVEPAQAALAHGPLARQWCQRALTLEGGLRSDLRAPLVERLSRPSPLPLLARALVEELARA